jgi:DNA topoisomerase-1
LILCGKAGLMDAGAAISAEEEAKAAARAAQLRYVTDRRPGITRHRTGASFSYRDPGGKLIRDAETLGRIKRLAIPPAWESVWISPDANGHIQAVGRDARGRKQYRYHPRWRSFRDEAKFERITAFAEKLPAIRARVTEDLARPGMPREKVLATVVRLLETTLIRVGNDEYARENKSYGLTTLRNRHARVNGRKVVFNFTGKSGIEHRIDVEDAALARIVRKCREIPGQDLFTYLDDEGTPRDVGSADVNDYLRAIAGEDVTAKDFRTWAATTLAAVALESFKSVDTKAALKRNVRRAVEAVAGMLGNTPTVCRKCYVHPAILDGYLDGTLVRVLHRRAKRVLAENLAGLRPEEAAVLAFLQQRLSAAGGQKLAPAPAGGPKPRRKPARRPRKR